MSSEYNADNMVKYKTLKVTCSQVSNTVHSWPEIQTFLSHKILIYINSNATGGKPAVTFSQLYPIIFFTDF